MKSKNTQPLHSQFISPFVLFPLFPSFHLSDDDDDDDDDGGGGGGDGDGDVNDKDGDSDGGD